MPTEGGGNGGDRPKNSSEDGNKEGEVRGAQVVDNVPGIGYRQDKDGSYSRFDSGHKCGPNCTLDHWTTKDQIRANGELLMLFVGGEAVKWVFRGGKWVLSGTRAAKTGTQTFKSVGAAGRSWKNVKMMSDNLLKKQGLDAHAIKTEFLGPKNISKYDLYKHTDTGEILIFGKGGKGEPIFTGYFVK